MPMTTEDEARRAAWWLLGYWKAIEGCGDGSIGDKLVRFQVAQVAATARQIAEGGAFNPLHVYEMLEVYRELSQ